MRLFGGFSLGRWLGFEISIDYSWFFLFFLVVWTLSSGHFPAQLPGGSPALYYTMGTVAAVLVFVSVLLHELSHSIVARTRGLEVEGITLFIFGGVARTRMEAETAADEFLLTAAGPVSSLLLGAGFWGASVAAGTMGGSAPVVAVAETLAVINVGLAVFNMIPGFPLDGGRIFRSLVWHFTGDVEKATRWATRGGQAFGYLLVAYGAWALVQGAMVEGLWAAFIGWFLSSAAGSSWQHFQARRVLAHVDVGRVMTRDPVVVDADTTVETLVEDYFLRRPYTAYPVVEGSRVLGLVTLDDAAGLSQAERAATRAADVMTPAEDAPTAAPDEPLDDVLTRLQTADLDRALVVEGDRLAGLLTLGEIAGWLERARKLGRDGEGEAARPGARGEGVDGRPPSPTAGGGPRGGAPPGGAEPAPDGDGSSTADEARPEPGEEPRGPDAPPHRDPRR